VTFGLNSESTYDWNAEAWTASVNATVGQIDPIGKRPVSFTGGARYWLDAPDGGPGRLGRALRRDAALPQGALDAAAQVRATADVMPCAVVRSRSAKEIERDPRRDELDREEHAEHHRGRLREVREDHDAEDQRHRPDRSAQTK
jgi:hypothetical protein